MTFSLAAVFVLGAVCASFVGAAAARAFTGWSIVSDRSRCDACGIVLPSAALIPIFSFIAFRRRALCCGARLSFGAPLSEAITGALFAYLYLTLGPTPLFALSALALLLLLFLVLYDLAHQILPPFPLMGFVLISALVWFLRAPSLADAGQILLTAGIIAFLFALTTILSKGKALGLADAPLVFGLALFAGPAAIPGLVFSFWIGAVIGIILLARRPQGSTMGSEVPFAPFLAAGFLLAYLTQWDPFVLTALLPK